MAHESNDLTVMFSSWMGSYLRVPVRRASRKVVLVSTRPVP